MNRQAFNGFLRRVGFGHNRHAETQFGRLLQTFLAARRRAYFTGQADFAKGQKTFRQRRIALFNNNLQVIRGNY